MVYLQSPKVTIAVLRFGLPLLISFVSVPAFQNTNITVHARHVPSHEGLRWSWQQDNQEDGEVYYV